MADQARVEIKAKLFLQVARDNGWWLTLDLNIGLADAAALAGMKPKTMRNVCAAGNGPRTYRRGGTGSDGRRHRVAVGIIDLAAWLESKEINYCL